MTGCSAKPKETTASESDDGSIRIETVDTDGFSMDYFKFGNGDKTMVILPGLSVDSVMKYADAVAGAYSPMTDEFTIYVFDRRKELPESYSIAGMAQDTAAAIRALGLDDIYLFGASQGGMIAQEIAIANPDLVSKMILGSTSAKVGSSQYQTISNWISLAEAGDAEGLYLAFGEAIYPQEVFEQSRDFLIESAAGITDEDLERFVILAGTIEGFDVTGRLNSIKCPVLVIGASDDQVLGAEASEDLADLLGCEIHMYTGYGHAAYDLAPDYKDVMMDFFVK